MKHDKENCDCPYNREPKLISRATWICPICERDVSIEYLFLEEQKINLTNKRDK
jgi:hypothetical protein